MSEFETFLTSSTLRGSISGGTGGYLSPHSVPRASTAGEKAVEGGSSRSPVGDKQETLRPLPRPHRVREENPAVAKHRDTPAARAWIRPRAPPRAPQSPTGPTPFPRRSGPATPCPRGPRRASSQDREFRAAPGASPAPGRRPSPRTLHSCCP